MSKTFVTIIDPEDSPEFHVTADDANDLDGPDGYVELTITDPGRMSPLTALALAQALADAAFHATSHELIATQADAIGLLNKIRSSIHGDETNG